MKKQRRNGFTLIELLAVIIILGIVALIATPIVINVVENAQRKAFERSAQGYYDAAKYVHNDMMLGEDEQDIMFIFENGQQRSDNPKYALSVQGEVPKKGLVYLSKSGEILVSIANDKWCATTNGDGTIELTDDPNGCGYAPDECYTFSDFTLTDGMKRVLNSKDLGFEGMDAPLLQVEWFDQENPSCKGIVIIPEEHDGRKVEVIGSSAFEDANITNVILPRETKIIDDQAFLSSTGDENGGPLKQIVMNDELRWIGHGAFYVNQLSNVTIPSKVVYIGDYAFQYNMLTNISIPGTVYNIGREAFSYNFLTNVDIGNGVEEISSMAFENNQITNLKLPESVAVIDLGAFRNNKITSLDLPSGLEYMESNVFQGNQIVDLKIGEIINDEYSFNSNSFAGSPLTNLTIKEGVTTIKDNLFKDHEIVNLTLPSTLISIGKYAFRNNKIEKLVIPEGVTTIGTFAFAENQINDLNLPTTLTKIDSEVFNHNELTSVNLPNTIKEISSYAFSWNKLTSLEIPASVTTIGYGAFYNNQIKSLEIPSTVQTVGDEAFAVNQLTNLVRPYSVSIGKHTFNNNQLPDDQAFIYSSGSKTVIVGYGGAKRDNVIIPEGVTRIGEEAFYGSGINSVTIPEGVTTIQKRAFYVVGLTSITIPASVTSIAQEAFSGNKFENADAITILGDNPNRFDSTWTYIGFPAK